MKYFIFGADGYVGGYLYDRLKEDGEDVVGTSYHADTKYVHYNIRENIIPDAAKGKKAGGKAAIICIANADITDCFTNYQNAYDVNVAGMKKLIASLLEAGFYVIYFSTDCVFDGALGNYTEESERHPINEYGKMKAEMEEHILENNLLMAVFRISRVVSPRRGHKNPFTQLSDMAKETPIRCIKGNYLSYVSVEDIYQICKIAVKKKLYGLFNVCGDKAYSRKELAEKYITKINLYGIEIVEKDVSEFGFKDNQPLNVSMINHKIQSVVGYRFTSMDQVIEEYIRRN